jgi:hypothetical protein
MIVAIAAMPPIIPPRADTGMELRSNAIQREMVETCLRLTAGQLKWLVV